MELGPRRRKLIASVMDLPLLLMRAAGIRVASALSSPAILEVLPPSTALPVMGVAILYVWDAHCSPETSPFHKSAPEASCQRVCFSCPWSQRLHELTVCPVMVTEVIPELTVCPVTATEALALPAPPWPPAPPWLPALPIPSWLPALPIPPFPHAPGMPLLHNPGPVPLRGPGPPSLPHSASAPPPSWTFWVLFGHQEPPLEGGNIRSVLGFVSCSCFNVLF